MKQKALVLIAALFVTLICAAQAHAQALRTFVAVAGSDANDCTFSTPCRTFAGAVPQTAPGGEITALDSGAYAVVTIDKAVTLQAAPGAHVALGDGTSNSAVTINAGASDQIVLRNLYISRVGRVFGGIEVNSGGVLHLEGCVVTGFASSGGYGIRTSGCNDSGACIHLFIKDTILRENYYGISLQSASAVIDHSWIENNTLGLTAAIFGGAVIRESVVAGNSNTGLFASSLGSIRVEGCLVTRNGTGISSIGDAFGGQKGRVWVSNTMIVGNVTGLNPTIGPQEAEIISFGNNRLAANTTNGAFTSTIPQK